MLAKHLSRRVPENMNHIYVLFLLGNTLVKAFSSENTKKKKKSYLKPSRFSWVSGARLWRQVWEEACGWEACRMHPLKPGCWLCAQIRAAVPQGSLSSQRSLVFQSTWHRSRSESYRHLWVTYQHRASRLYANSPTLLVLGEEALGMPAVSGKRSFCKEWWMVGI